jgi:hypothetical protein
MSHLTPEDKHHRDHEHGHRHSNAHDNHHPDNRHLNLDAHNEHRRPGSQSPRSSNDRNRASSHAQADSHHYSPSHSPHQLHDNNHPQLPPQQGNHYLAYIDPSHPPQVHVNQAQNQHYGQHNIVQQFPNSQHPSPVHPHSPEQSHSPVHPHSSAQHSSPQHHYPAPHIVASHDVKFEMQDRGVATPERSHERKEVSSSKFAIFCERFIIFRRI